MAIIWFVSPHPDDIEIFCGGALLKHYRQGDKVHLLMITRGGAGTIHPGLSGDPLRKIRTGETMRRYSLLPEVKIHWLDMIDGQVKMAKREWEKFTHLLSIFSPDCIYLPESKRNYTVYKHPDHFAASQILEAALMRQEISLPLRYYHSNKHDIIFDIGSVYAENNRAARYYRSQAGFWANPPYLLPLILIWRKIMCIQAGKKIKCRYAEAFREILSGKLKI